MMSNDANIDIHTTAKKVCHDYGNLKHWLIMYVNVLTLELN